MYKVYVDKGFVNKNKVWKSISGNNDYELIVYNGFSDLVMKLSVENKSIVYLYDYSSNSDCYDKARVLKGKFPNCAINIVANGVNINPKHLNRIGVNALIKGNDSNAILDNIEQSSRLVDAYISDQYVHIDDNELKYKDINVVSVIGPSGGVGKTTIATNLAASFAEFGLKTCLVDLSLQFGDVGLFTNIKPTFTVYDLMVNNSDFNPNMNLFIQHVNPNLFVLPAPVLPEQADYITRSMVTKMIKNLSLYFDVVVFDTPSIINDICLELFQLSHQIVLVTTKDLGSLKNSKLAIDILTKLNVESRLKLVLNKYDSPKFVVENEAVRRMLGVDIISLIPHTNTITGNAINMGVPFIYSYPREHISDAIRELMSKVRYNCIVGDSRIEKK
jgi:pilus assembly protein CpaE